MAILTFNGKRLDCSNLLVTDTFNEKAWNRWANIDGSYVWKLGSDIYYSNGTEQYVLDRSTSHWVPKTWNGLTSFDGTGVWKEGSNIYYSNSSAQYVLDVSTR